MSDALDLFVPDRDPTPHSIPLWLDYATRKRCQCMPCLVATKLQVMVPEMRRRGLPWKLECELREYSDL